MSTTTHEPPIEFTGATPFEALNKAQKWCDYNKISYGPTCTAGLVGLKRGEWIIAKWRNLSAGERAGCDGIMSGDFRNGPVFIEMKPQ